MLKVENLCVSYGAINALRGISFEVHKGEIITLIGSNGAGKTTTLHAISNIIPPRISIMGVSSHTPLPRGVSTPLPFAHSRIIAEAETSRVSRG